MHAPLPVIVFSSTFGFEEMRLVWEDGEGGRGQVEGSIWVDIKSESDCGRLENPSSFSAPEMEVRFREESEEEDSGIC